MVVRSEVCGPPQLAAREMLKNDGGEGSERNDVWKNGRLPRLEATGCFESRAGRLVGGYLRAAQAYMLISMPTGTSTIFGVFQVIRVSQVSSREVHAETKVGPPRT